MNKTIEYNKKYCLKQEKVLQQGGFTLIETLLYVALFSALVPALLFTAMHLLEVSTRSQHQAYAEMEAQFIFSKLDQLLENAVSVSATPGALRIETNIASEEQVVVTLSYDPDQRRLMLQRGTDPADFLIASPVSVVSFESQIHTEVGQPTMVTVSMGLAYQNYDHLYHKTYALSSLDP